MANERSIAGRIGLEGYAPLLDANWNVWMDENLFRLSIKTSGTVQDIVTALPGSPTEGDIVLLDASAGSNPNEIAAYDDGAWRYLPPWEGFQLWVEDENKFIYYDGSSWVDLIPASLGNFLALSDTPGTYSGFGGFNLRVTSGEDGVEFVDNVTGLSVQDEGGNVGTGGDVQLINFVGAGVTATAGGAIITVTIPGGGGGSAISIEDDGNELSAAPTKLNFVGFDLTEGVTDEITITLPSGTGQPAFLLALSDETTALAAAVEVSSFRAPYAFEILGVKASLRDASTSGAVEVDVKVNGSSILSTNLTIDQGETTSVTAAVAAVISSANVADDDEVTFDIVSAGTDATGLKVSLVTQVAGNGLFAELETVATTNGDFETGDLTGWTTVTGTLQNVTGSNLGISGAYEGTRYLFCETPTLAVIYHEWDLGSVLTKGGLASVQLRRAFPAGTDTTEFALIYLNSSDVEIGRTETTATNARVDDTWYAETIHGIAPEGTAKIRLQISAINLEGSNATTAIDDVSALTIVRYTQGSGGSGSGQSIFPAFQTPTAAEYTLVKTPGMSAVTESLTDISDPACLEVKATGTRVDGNGMVRAELNAMTGSEATFRYECAYLPNILSTNDVAAGIFLAQGVDNVYQFRWTTSNEGNTLLFSRFGNDGDTFGTNGPAGQTLIGSLGAQHWNGGLVWMAVEYDGTDYFFEISYDGRNWLRMVELNEAGSAMTGQADDIGFYVEPHMNDADAPTSMEYAISAFSHSFVST